MNLCPVNTSTCRLNNSMRLVWAQHATWTRMVIISIAEGLADEKETTSRLLRNPVDTAALFRPLYGGCIADRLQSLLIDHLTLAAQLVKAAKAGNAPAAAEFERRWYANADEIAALLSAINPYWSRETQTTMWHMHLAQVKSQAVARLNKDYASDIAFYDEGERHIMEMADDLTCGILSQFPWLVNC